MTALDIAHKDRAHSAVGGSTAKRVLNCTASVNHCAKYPNESNAFADMGTALTCTHQCIKLKTTNGVLQKILVTIPYV